MGPITSQVQPGALPLKPACCYGTSETGQGHRAMRTATIERKTRETEILASVDLDGSGLYDVDTGIGFLDHMLESFSRHSLIDLKVRAQGDLHVDFHHTTEDTGHRHRPGDQEGAGRFLGHQPLRLDPDADGRDADARRHRHLEPALSDLERQLQAPEDRRDGHRAVPRVVPGAVPERRASACTSRRSTARTAITSSRPASRARRARCARRSRSTNGSRAAYPRPKRCSPTTSSG